MLPHWSQLTPCLVSFRRPGRRAGKSVGSAKQLPQGHQGAGEAKQSQLCHCPCPQAQAASGGTIRASLEILRDRSLPSSPLPTFTPPFPYGSCESAAAQASITHFRLILQPPSAPTCSGVSWGGSCLQPAGSAARAVLPAMSSGTAPAQTPVTCQDICPLHLLCTAKTTPAPARARPAQPPPQEWFVGNLAAETLGGPFRHNHPAAAD